MLRAVLPFGAFLVASVSATGHPKSDATPAGVLRTLTTSPHLNGVPPDFECAWRTLAFDFATKIQPFRSAEELQLVHDGLELGSLCNESFVAPAPVPAVRPAYLAPPTTPATTLYVDYVAGNDGAAGTQAAPLQHIVTAVAKARTSPQPVLIYLRGGVHRLTTTIALTSADSGLTLSAFPGESPVVTSGTVIKPTWTPVTAAPATPPAAAAAALPSALRAVPRSIHSQAPCVWTSFPNVDSMWGEYPDPLVTNLSSMPSAEACSSACQVRPGCFSWTYYSPTGGHGSQWDGKCFASAHTVWSPTPQASTTSGYCYAPPPPPNVYVADLGAAGTPLPTTLTSDPQSSITLFFSPDGGATPQRAIRARWPNADPEVQQFPTGWSSGGVRAGATCTPASSTVTDVPLPENYGPGMFSDYLFGSGGACDRFEVGEWSSGQANISYWCQPGGRTAGCSYYVRTPTSLALTPALLPHGPSYGGNVGGDGGTVHWWRDGHWFSLMGRLTGATTDPTTNVTTLAWDRGGFQGAEGDSNGAEWFVEHVKEELDAPREFFFEAATQKLYYDHNDTAGTPPPSTWTWEVPLLRTLVNISSGAADITIQGLSFTGAAATFLAPHGIPSGGDWGLARQGAIFITDADRILLSTNTFTRLDGNAVFLSGRTRNVTILRNHFAWLGESAVASWGYSNGVDATQGLQPWGTLMHDNLCREIGIYEKQVSCYFAAVTAQATVQGNIMFNMPRAAMNINDDMGGGSALQYNLVWNTCRESQDHGPFNSWGRVPYLFPWPNGTISHGIKAQYDDMNHNFIVAGGGANGGAFDTDDGSSFHLFHHNAQVYGGHKSDFDGHAKRSFSNVHAFSSVYGTKCLGISNLPHAAVNDFFAEGYWDNKCILATAGAPYLEMGDCATDAATFPTRMIVGNNTVYAPNASATVSCGKGYSFQEWVALGLDQGTTIADVPATADIIQMFKDVLGMW